MELQSPTSRNSAYGGSRTDVGLDLVNPVTQTDSLSLSLLDLPWDTVLCCHILPYLSIKDRFRMRAVSSACRDLVQLHFELSFSINTSRFRDNFSAQAFEMMSRNCCCLKVLSLRGAKSWLTNDLLLPVIANNPRLETVDLTGCLSLSGASVCSIGVRCQNLKYLSVRDCVWLVKDNLFTFFSQQRPLEYLDLTGCWNLDDDIIVSLVTSHPCLRYLQLGNLYGLTDESIHAVAHHCPHLVQLNISGCWRITDKSINLVGKLCTKLKFLNIKECYNIADATLLPLRDQGVHIDRPLPLKSFIQNK